MPVAFCYFLKLNVLFMQQQNIVVCVDKHLITLPLGIFP